MSNPELTIGLTVIGFLVPYALFEVYDAWKYSHHPNESLKREIRNWGVVLSLWFFAVWVAA